MTLLLPVLLDKVPNFYVPGRFDDELDQYSSIAEKVSTQELEQKRGDSEISSGAQCKPEVIANNWLKEFDTAIERNDVSAIMAMFATDTRIRATVRGSNGNMTTVKLSRDELAQSTVDSMKGLTNYKQRRVSTDSKLLNDSNGELCNLISIKSVVIEEGLHLAKPFHFESLEDYEIELRGQKWLSIKAETTQQ
jgi:hypothetical protein